MPNRVRYDGRAGRFYEVWYFIFNDPATGDGFWIRYTLLNPLDDHPAAGAALWFAHTSRSDPAESVAIRRTWPRGSFEAPPGDLRLRIADAELEDGAARGRFEADGHSVAWDLRYTPSETPHYYFGPWLRRWSEQRTSVTIPNPSILLSGSIEVDGRCRTIEAAPGHQAHHWGTTRASSWLWAHCNTFEDEPAVLELLSPTLPGGWPVAFVNLHTGDARFACNGPAGMVRNRATAGLGFWQFQGYADDHRIVADITVDPRFVQAFTYISPEYRESECWNTQVGDCLVRVYRRTATGEHLERVLRARGTAAAEIHDEDLSRIPYLAWHRGAGAAPHPGTGSEKQKR